jgi:DNA (cytosine-5)-methyltransferase 1
MKVLSLFSGVGGFDLGLEAAGMETVFQCEWDKHATNILERHWPHIPRWGDVSTLTGKFILLHAPVIDVVAWGSPCQDLSVAGKRAGLEGSRSGLFHEGVRIIKELRKETNNEYPRISIWENVYGALNSNRGADFGVILNEMAEAGALVQEWRVLDAQYFGVPQRRRRVFLISIFDTATATRCPDPLLPVSEGVQWHPATSHTTRQTVTGETSASFGSGSYGGWTATDTAITLSQRDYKSSNTITVEPFTPSQFAQYTEGVGTLRSNGGDLAGGSETLAVFTKSKRPQTATDDETWVANQPNPTLNAFDQGDTRTTTVIVEDPVLMRQREGKPGGGKGPLLSNNKSLTLSGGNDQTLFQPAEDPIVFENSYRDAARIAEDGITQTLTSKMGTGGGNTPMIAFPIQDGREMEKNQNGIGVADDGTPAYTIDRTGAQAVAYSVREDAKANTFSATELDKANSLSALRPSPQSHHAQMFIAEQPTMAVRRLTPLECERLMGWPDDWTAGQSDTHRYKQCGNGVASPVAQWIAEQLLKL